MTGPSFELDPVERLTAGATGEPGERTFYVQAVGVGEAVTLLAEKDQVRLLAEAAQRLLEQLPEAADEGTEPAEVELALAEPLEPEWRVGEMAIEYDAERDRIAIVLNEVAPVTDETDDEPLPGVDLATARFVATRAQVRAMAEHALEVVAAGRPRCQLCGYAMEPTGDHVCPALNGHGRPAR